MASRDGHKIGEFKLPLRGLAVGRKIRLFGGTSEESKSLPSTEKVLGQRGSRGTFGCFSPTYPFNLGSAACLRGPQCGPPRSRTYQGCHRHMGARHRPDWSYFNNVTCCCSCRASGINLKVQAESCQGPKLSHAHLARCPECDSMPCRDAVRPASVGCCSSSRMKGPFAAAARERAVINIHSWPYIIIAEEEKAVIIRPAGTHGLCGMLAPSSALVSKGRAASLCEVVSRGPPQTVPSPRTTASWGVPSRSLLEQP